jgi:hypothetical protein
MRKLVLVGLWFACLGVAPSALACDDNEVAGEEVASVNLVAFKQSQAFIAEATRLEGRAEMEESASFTVQANARVLRRKAATFRAQAFQVAEPSRSTLLAMADKLNTEAAHDEMEASAHRSRAKTIRARAQQLRALSDRVLAGGPMSKPVRPRRSVQL